MSKFIPCTIALTLIASGLEAATTKPEAARFADVTHQAGVGVVADSHGIALGDYDGDEFIDVYVAAKEPPKSALLRNRADGTFDDVTRTAGLLMKNGEAHAAAWGDFDGDGRLGLYVGNWRSSAPIPNTLFEQNGDGTFRDATVEAGLSDVPAPGSHGVAVGDFDNDGWLDIFASAARATALLLRNNGNGTFRDDSARSGMQYSRRSHFLSPVDWDEDGWLDILVSSTLRGGGAANRLYHNRGHGVFEDIVAKTPLAEGDLHGGRFADFDNDGDLDLVAPHAEAESPHGYYVNSGRRLKDIGQQSGLYLGPERVHPLAVGDYDNDGLLDIFMGAMGGGTMLFRNLGRHRFQDVGAQMGLPRLPGAKAAGFFDYDNDGWLDLFVAVSKRPCRLFRNPGGDNHWLKVRLVGTRSNRDAVGARIFVRTGPRLQMREVCGGTGHQQDPFIQHFGLGKSAKVDRLTVHWPSGTKQELTNVVADHTVVVKEE